MHTITFKIHSFIDLITNSSSEVFVAASKSTIDTVKEIINTLLKQGGSEKTCDDLFDVDIVIPKGTYFVNPDYDDEDDDSDEEIELKEDVPSTAPEYKKYRGWKNDTDNPYLDINLKVTAKTDDAEAIKTAKLFEKIIGTYTIEASQNY